MSPLLAIILMVAPFFVIIAVFRNQKRLSRIRSETVELEVDVFGVRRVLADGRTEGVDWLDVTEIEVLKTTSGPHGPSGGVIIVAGDEEHGCLVPIDQLQSSGLAEALTYLPGFDMNRLLMAITPTTPDETSWRVMDTFVRDPPTRTTCWTRPASS